MRSYLARILPFFVIFLCAQTLVRLILLAWYATSATMSALEMILAVYIGFLFDLNVFVAFALLYALFYFLFPTSMHTSKFDRCLHVLFLFVFTTGLTLFGILEVLYWREYATRLTAGALSFVTHAWQALMQSPSSLLVRLAFGLLLVFATLITFGVHRVFPFAGEKKSMEQRIMPVVVCSLLLLLFYFVIQKTIVMTIGAEHWKTVAENGIYTFIMAS